MKQIQTAMGTLAFTKDIQCEKYRVKIIYFKFLIIIL